MTTHGDRLSRSRPAFDILETAPHAAQDDVTEELVRRTISESIATGLPERSKQRIQRGLKKISAEPLPQPGGKPARAGSPKGLVVGVVCAATAVLLLPLWGILALVVLLAMGALIGVGLVGTDRVSALIVARYHRLKVADPERAERLRRRAARLSSFVMAIAARLPARWVQGLYLPDFEPAAELPEKMRSDPFERLSV